MLSALNDTDLNSTFYVRVPRGYTSMIFLPQTEVKQLKTQRIIPKISINKAKKGIFSTF